MNLYEIDKQLRILEEYQCNPETGEVLTEQEFYELYDGIEMALNEKIENTMLLSKNQRSDSKAIKDEIKKLEERAKAKDNLADRLDNRVDYYIKHNYTNEDGVLDEVGLNDYKMETPRLKLSYRKSTSVNILDQTKVPKQFIKVEKKESVMKAEIKKYLQGLTKKVKWAEIATNYNMQVK